MISATLVKRFLQ